MSTPFDNTTWKLRFTGPIDPSDTAHPGAIIGDAGTAVHHAGILPSAMPSAMPPVMARHGITGSIDETHRPPLKRNVRFMINIADDESAEVTFLGPVTSVVEPRFDNMRAIWADAQNVYYDREFYAVRGDLLYDLKEGKKSSSFGKHFVISYDGRKATGGSNRQLSIHLFDESSIFTPTLALIQPKPVLPPGTMMRDNGSWKADD